MSQTAWYHYTSHRYRGTHTLGGAIYLAGFRVARLLRYPALPFKSAIQAAKNMLGCFLSGAAFAWRGDERP